ncbi:MAG: oxidoreductase, partial [Bacteroidales bacterium]|nr:oxidoreductase [Bacteroidales bacterium]
ITGASSGIGKATALQLIGEGHKVYGAARRIEKMEDLVNAGGHALQMDVTSEEEIVDAVNQIIEENGRIDVLINNAGYAIYGAVEDTTLEDARRQFDVNIFGLARITQLVLPHMRSQNSGKIINVSSMGGKIYTPLGAWYIATKHALEGWSDCLRIETKEHGINVVVIEPGIIQSEFGDVMLDPMMERSGKGAYANIANSLYNTTKDSYKPGNQSPPSVIANLISKAMEANRPKTRYVAGKMAKPSMFMRKHLGDKTFDRLILSQLK